jgi:outer membrane biosynthesis protein TonB
MTALRAVGEPGREKLETAEVTYRTITYFPGEGAGAEPRAAAPAAVGATPEPAGGAGAKADDVSEVGVINDQALSLPGPAYPVSSAARRGPVVVGVEVVIDETGRVVSARANEGPALLREAAEAAARMALFLPFESAGRPVKARGLLNYTFPFNP